VGGLLRGLTLKRANLAHASIMKVYLRNGDFNPMGISRTIAVIEAFTGSFTIALFVVVFVKKITR